MSRPAPAISFFIDGPPKTKEKYCPECDRTRFAFEFYNNKTKIDGLSSQCKQCTKLRNGKRYTVNRDEILEQKRIRYASTPELRRSIKTRNLARYHSVVKHNPRKKLDWNIATDIRKSLKNGSKNGQKWESIVGYTIDQLMSHLEARFTPGMSWENHGRWHIDHVRPKSSFRYETPADPEFIECWSLSNLQPLWAKDNLSKSNRRM